MYCTQDDMEARFGKGVIDQLLRGRPQMMDAAITDASAVIDSYIGARYQLPLAEVPVMLTSVARDLVRHGLDTSPQPEINDRRREALQFLSAVSRGTATLGVPQAAEPVSLDTVEIESDGHVFSRRNSKGFI